MNKVAEYIKYRLKAKKRHGIHSPYVYNLSDKGLTLPLSNREKQIINTFVSQLLSNKESIEVTDHGSGSKRLNRTRRIKDIYKVSSSKRRYGKLLFQLTRHFKPTTILELGTSLGVGTLHMHLGAPDALITSIEGCPETARIAKENFERFHLNGIREKQGTFAEIIPLLDQEKFDLIFIDGHHDGAATLNYIRLLKDKIDDDTILLFDDIRWSDGMFNAWNTIVQDPAYHVTIDLFRMGIAVKRPTQEKEHFILNF